MTTRAWLYLGLAFAGLCLTWYHNVAFMNETGTMDLAAFVAAANANHAAASISWDVTIAALTFGVFAVAEGRRVGVGRPWLFLVLTFSVALAFAMPLFMFFRERALARAAAPGAVTAAG